MVYLVATSEAKVGLFADTWKAIGRVSGAKFVPNGYYNLDAERGDIFPRIATEFALGSSLAGAREIVVLLPTHDARDQVLRDIVIALLQPHKGSDAIKTAANIQHDLPRAQPGVREERKGGKSRCDGRCRSETDFEPVELRINRDTFPINATDCSFIRNED